MSPFTSVFRCLSLTNLKLKYFSSNIKILTKILTKIGAKIRPNDPVYPLNAVANKPKWYRDHLGYYECYVTNMYKDFVIGSEIKTMVPYYRSFVISKFILCFGIML